MCVFCIVPGLDSRGNSNILRNNICKNNAGAGVRIGGHTINGETFGLDNEVYGNILENNDYSAIKITVCLC